MVFDIHCHASLKQFIFGDKITNHHPFLLPDESPLGMHVDLHSMKQGDVRMAVCAHYLPESGLSGASIGGIPAKWLVLLIKGLQQKIEDPSAGIKSFDQTIQLMQDFESEINEAREKQGFNVHIAKNFNDLTHQLSTGATVFLHSIEGAHSLGHGLTTEEIKANLNVLIEMGLCQFTLAHFFDNILVPSQGGIPPSLRKAVGLDTVRDPNNGLTEVGKPIVEYLLDRGVIIDMVHCTPAVRQEILKINSKRSLPRPIVMSHTGLRSIACEGDMKNYPNDLLCLPSDDEVRAIIRTEGVIGVLFMNYWVNGTEEDNLFKTDNGIQDLVRTIKVIRNLEKEVSTEYDCDHISIGTDFDGFTQVPDDLVTEADMNKLIHALRVEDFTTEQIEKIAWKNYWRVLESGWGLTKDDILRRETAVGVA